MDPLSYLVSTRVAADIGALVFLKGTAVLVAVVLAATLVRSRSAAVRHRIWQAGFVALLALPILSATLPGWKTATLPYPTETMLLGMQALETTAPTAMTPAATPASPPATFPVASLLLILWWTGALIVTVRIVLDLLRAQFLRFRCSRLATHHAVTRLLDDARREMGIRRRVGLLVAREPGLAATVGSFRPEVVIGPDVAAMSHDELRPLLVHELAHVKRRDYLTYVLSTFALPVYWANPLIWWARKRAAVEREQACDDVVLSYGVASPQYARVLLDFAVARYGLAPTPRTTVAFLRFSPTRARIQSILDRTLDRRPAGVLAGAVVVFTTVGFALPTASLRVLESAPGTGTTTELVAALSHDDPAVRTRAARTLGRRDAGAVRVELERLLDDPVADVRLAAIGGLQQLAHPASLPALAHVLERPFDDGRGEHGFVLKYAMFTAGQIGTPEAIRLLEAQLDRPVAPLRWLALDILRTLPGAEAIAQPHLRRFAESDPSAHNRRAARQALTAN